MTSTGIRRAWAELAGYAVQLEEPAKLIGALKGWVSSSLRDVSRPTREAVDRSRFLQNFLRVDPSEVPITRWSLDRFRRATSTESGATDPASFLLAVVDLLEDLVHYPYDVCEQCQEYRTLVTSPKHAGPIVLCMLCVRLTALSGSSVDRIETYESATRSQLEGAGVFDFERDPDA